MSKRKLIIITGLSGSGKTAVSHFLEDLGFYCVDNLPSKLIPKLIELWKRKGEELVERVALVLDIREKGFLKNFPIIYKNLKEKGIPMELIFLEAKEETLLRRFKETRRPHPLSPGKSILEGIKEEKEKLMPIREMADWVLDTSDLSVSQLKEIIVKRYSEKKKKPLSVSIISFGYKYGIPIDSDLVFDVRFLPNPYYVDSLRSVSGRSKKVKNYLLSLPETHDFLKRLYDFLNYLLQNFIKEGKSYLTISVGCTGGKHRSVIIANEIKKYLQKNNYEVKVFHRDVNKL
ncbi:RNase adapter RapZ [Candidatus Aminicenantes bacterium AC-335-A11]|nr:RNase adapter RapZ [SCandidatus Aminicenantes bacterium Aminicenantia_JdfR_composite]MCP2596396.1 RNase adapter RapZ [Candidatus Aminicenantes bacterium AC-335-G13]MCP2618226.1 RNase adapter RapZ [Candidatus Aminicenantes bacterium AC-335-A11]